MNFAITLMQAITMEGVGCHPLVNNSTAKYIKFSIYVGKLVPLYFS